MQSLLIFYATFLNNKKTCKNRHLRTFVIPKIDWWCLWRHHALCLKALDLYYPAKTYMMKISCVERHIFNNLCKALPSKITKNYTFSNRNSLWMAFGEYQNEKIATFLRLSSQNLIHVSWDHPVWFCGYPRTQRCLWKQILNSKVIRNFFRGTWSQTITFCRKHFLVIQMRFSWQFFIIVENHEKIATSARLR